MKKYLFRVFGYVILSAVIAGMGWVIGVQKKRIKEQSQSIEYLQNENNELRKLKTYHFEVKLNVTDKSRNNIYGRYNKGIIEMPSAKTYMLEIDSTSINLK